MGIEKFRDKSLYRAVGSRPGEGVDGLPAHLKRRVVEGLDELLFTDYAFYFAERPGHAYAAVFGKHPAE